MPNISILTLPELQAATQPQIVANINAALSKWDKRKLIVFLMDGETVNDPPIVVSRPDKQVASQTEVLRDVETGKQVGRRVMTWEYFPTGEVKRITTSDRDAANAETGAKAIVHDAPGAPPKKIETKPKVKVIA